MQLKGRPLFSYLLDENQRLRKDLESRLPFEDNKEKMGETS